jgi:hypothetical protein
MNDYEMTPHGNLFCLFSLNAVKNRTPMIVSSPRRAQSLCGTLCPVHLINSRHVGKCMVRCLTMSDEVQFSGNDVH